MTARPFFLRGYLPKNDFQPTFGHTEPTTMMLDTHRVIHLEQDYWVSPEELSDLTAEDALAHQVVTAAVFWVGLAGIGLAFGAMSWLGVLPA